MNDIIYSVALDGPAGAGKSTVTKLLAEKLGWNYLNTGALYRAFAVKCMQMGINPQNPDAMQKAVDYIKVDMRIINGQQHFFANNDDVTHLIRLPEVSGKVALYAPFEPLRKEIRKLQRKIASENNVIIEGRDIGTVVLPNSVNKIYLDVPVEIRAIRRYNEYISSFNHLKELPKGILTYKEVLDQVKERDRLDEERENSPLTCANDAIRIFAGNKTPEQITSEIISKMTFEKSKQKPNKIEPELIK